MNCSSVTPVWTTALGQLVNSVAISDDGERIVAGTYFHDYSAYGGARQFGVYAFAAASATPLWTWPLTTDSEGAYWVACSADGSYGAAGGKLVVESVASGFIQAYDLRTGAVALDYQLEGSYRVNKVALSADGGVLVACANDGMYFTVRNGATYGPPQFFPLSDSPQSIAISGSGDWIVVGGYSGTVTMCQNVSGTLELAQTWSTPGGAEVRCVNMTADGVWFGIAGGAQKTGGLFALFRTADFAKQPQPVWTQTSKGAVYFVALANPEPDSPVVAGVSNIPWDTSGAIAPAPPQSSPGGVRIVNTDPAGTPTPLMEFTTVQAPNSASMDAKAQYLAVADGFGETSDGHFYLIDLNRQTCRWAYETAKMSWPIAIAAQATGIAAGSDDSALYYFTP